MALTPSAVRRKVIEAIKGIALPANDQPVFSHYEGVFTGLIELQGDRQFIVVPRNGSESTPERGIGANESVLTLEITIAYQLTENSSDRTLDDSARVKRAFERLQDGIQRKEIEALPFDYGTVPNGVLLVWLLTIRYFETSEV